MTQTLRIDAHHHFWQIGKYSYPWIEPGGVLDQSFGPGELAPLLALGHFERSILVQSIPSLDETRWFLELAEAHPKIAGVVGWVDLTAAESIAALDRHLGQTLDDAFGIGTVTLGTLAGEDRGATTAIAEWLREQVLDDGNYAAGVRAHSKYGGGLCWAYWLRRQDDRLGPDSVEVEAETEIHWSDADLNYVLSLYGLECR